MFEFLVSHVWLIRGICFLVLLVGGWIWLNVDRGLPALNWFLNLGIGHALVTIGEKEDKWEVLSSSIDSANGPEGRTTTLTIRMMTPTAAKRVFTLCYSEEIPNAVYVYYEDGEVGFVHASLALAWKNIYFLPEGDGHGTIYFY